MRQTRATHPETRNTKHESLIAEHQPLRQTLAPLGPGQAEPEPELRARICRVLLQVQRYLTHKNRVFIITTRRNELMLRAHTGRWGGGADLNEEEGGHGYVVCCCRYRGTSLIRNSPSLLVQMRSRSFDFSKSKAVKSYRNSSTLPHGLVKDGGVQ